MTKKEVLQQFGIILKTVRETKKMTLAEVEALSGIETGNISRIESGEKNIELTTLLKLISALDIDANTLITPELVEMIPKP